MLSQSFDQAYFSNTKFWYVEISGYKVCWFGVLQLLTWSIINKCIYDADPLPHPFY